MQDPPADWSIGRAAGPLFRVQSALSLLSAHARSPAPGEPPVIAVRLRAMKTPNRSLAAGLILAAVLVAACGGASATPSPTIIDSAAAAAKAVAARTPLFGGIGPKDPNLIGQSAWYEATPKEAAKPPVGWSVTFRVGWGDCPAGCIDQHTWTYDLGVDGTVTFVSENGPALPADVIESLRAASRVTGLGGRVSAGPGCPVAKPGDPACDDKPVKGAVLVVKGAGGLEVARVTTDASGLFRIPLQPGDYTLQPQAVEGLMGTASPMPFTVREGAETFLDVSYDTGIR